jgi:leucyl aminopeptidase
MKVSAASTDPREVSADAVVVPVFKGGIEGPGVQLLLPEAGLDDIPVTPQFRGDIGQHLLLAAPPGRAVVFVGLGRIDETDADQLRRAAAGAARATRDFRRVATTLAEVHPTTAAVEAVAEGFHLGAHEDRRFRSDPEKGAARLREVVVLVPSSRLWEARLAIERAGIYARATIFAR